MTKNVRNEKGFTLLEVIVVLAVLGALAAMLSPVVFRYIDDANRTRAQADVSMIAASINNQYKDTGRWAFYAVGTGGGPIAYESGTDAAILTSNDACTTAATNLATCDTTEPEVGSAAGWLLSSAKADSLSNQLMENAPTYATTGARAWKGPYLGSIPAFDPWSRSYLVNIGEAPGSIAVIVLSAGPNGIIETNGNTAGTTNLVAGGDDVIARVK